MSIRFSVALVGVPIAADSGVGFFLEMATYLIFTLSLFRVDGCWISRQYFRQVGQSMCFQSYGNNDTKSAPQICGGRVDAIKGVGEGI